VAAKFASTAVFEAKRCLSCGNCFECDNCLAACPEQAIAWNFQVDLDRCRDHRACVAACGAIGAIDFDRKDTTRTGRFDAVLDLSTERWFSQHQPPQGYFAPGADPLEPMVTYGTNPGMGIPITSRVPSPADQADPGQRRAPERALEDHEGIERRGLADLHARPGLHAMFLQVLHQLQVHLSLFGDALDDDLVARLRLVEGKLIRREGAQARNRVAMGTRRGVAERRQQARFDLGRQRMLDAVRLFV